jgi:hypothetical protein
MDIEGMLTIFKMVLFTFYVLTPIAIVLFKKMF